MTPHRRLAGALLSVAPLLFFAAIVTTFAIMSPRFRTWENAENILIHASSTAIVATGMTFVLLTAGIDLSVGAIMFVAAVVAGKLVLESGASVTTALAAMVAVGLACGAMNAVFVTRLRMVPFIVTLATLFIWRGIGLWLSQTRAMNLPDEFHQIATARVVGLPAPLLLLITVVGAAHLVLTRTPYGRQIYAVGDDPEAARKAGIAVGRIVASVYIVSGGLAALGGIVSLAQLAAVSPTFGRDRELEAIAAAVLGGVSLFGGRGNAFAAVLGALMISTVYSGLIAIRASEYTFPVITGSVIFFAVLLDSLRHRRRV
jgi:ribose transport system permease protein